MRIDVDYDRCASNGLCEEMAPEVFRLDEKGDLYVLVEEVPGELEAGAEAAVRACPVAALKTTG